MNQKKQLITLLCLLALVAAGILLWLQLREDGSFPQEEAPQELIPVYGAEAEALDIAIKNSFGSYNIVLDYSGGSPAYRVAQYNAEVPMNTGRLSYLGEGAFTLNALARYGGESDLAQYGLLEPAAQAAIAFADGTITRLYIGILAPDGETVYLRAEGDNLSADASAVYLVRLDDIDHILLGATDLISPIVTGSYPAGGFFETAVLSGSLREHPITVTRLEGSAYTVEQNGVAHPIHPYMGLASLLSVYGTTADEAVAVYPTDAMLEAYGLLEPYSATLLQSDAERLELWASEPDEEDLCYLYLPGNPVVYRIPASRLYWLELDAFRLSDPSIIRPAPRLEDLDGIRLTFADEVHTISFSHNQGADPDVLLDGTITYMNVMRPFLQTLLTPQATAFGESPIGNATLLLEVTFLFANGGSDTYRFFTGEEEQVYVTGSDGAVYLAPEGYVQKVIADFNTVSAGDAVTPWVQ